MFFFFYHWRDFGDKILNALHISFDLKYSTDLQLAQQDSPEGSAPVENVFVDKKAVVKLTEGLLSHYLPDLQNSKRALQELTWVFPSLYCFITHLTFTPDDLRQS